MAGCCSTTSTTLTSMRADSVRAAVADHYGAAARSVTEGGCCGTSGCADPITSDLYQAGQLADLPADAVAASLGCGNPTALAELREGEVVLDLGSGGGIDVLLTARRVGPTGKAYGLDMTEEMLELARRNQREAGVENAEFLRGHIEQIPLPDEAVDVVISNCVINLSPEKDKVLQEAFRVLRPGGRFAVSDMVFDSEPPAAVRRTMGLWGACVGGALSKGVYAEALAAAGFQDIEIEVTREYGRELIESYPELKSALGGEGAGLSAAFVRARK